MTKLLRKEQYFHGPPIPLLNSGNWNPALHPRDFHGEFRYNGGRHHQAKPAKAIGASALHNALSKLKIDTTYMDQKNGKANRHGIFITHYGPGTKVGGWDPYNDSNTNKGLGKGSIELNALSLAVSQDIVKTAGLN